MSRKEEQMITKEAIVDYVEKMEIKKVSLGGYDKVDVYVHIQELVKLYGSYMEQELEKQSKTIEDQQEEIRILSDDKKAAEKDLQVSREYIQACEKELEIQREKTESLSAHQEEVSRLNNEITMKKDELEKKDQELEELRGYKNSALELQKETERLKADNVRLSSGKGFLYRQDQTVESLKKELENQKKEANDQKKELEELRHDSENQKKELQQRIQEVESLKARLETEQEHDNSTEQESAEALEQTQLLLIEEMQMELREKEQVITGQEERIQSLLQESENQKQENQGIHDYEENIEEILSEARREGQNIIDNARIDAEQEMVRLLKLRVRFKQEKELYHEWCQKVESEKEAVEVFLKQLTTQYSSVNQALQEVKERADSFNIKRIYQIESNGKENTGETNYEEEDS